jgi:hypothetical protein
MKILKLFKKIKPIYIILGLFVVVLIVSALGSKTKEGMTSSDYITLRTYQMTRDSILRDINNFVNIQDATWGDKGTFKNNLGKYIQAYTGLSTKTYFKSKDSSNAGNVVVSTMDGTFIRDNSNNVLKTGEKLYYYDKGSKDKDKNSMIVSYKNTDQGNFYQDDVDNSGNKITAQSLAGTPYILETLNDSDYVTKEGVDAARALLDNQIAKLKTTADKGIINNNLSKLVAIIDKIVALTTIGKGSSTIDLYDYDPNNFNRYRPDEDDDDDDKDIYDKVYTPYSMKKYYKKKYSYDDDDDEYDYNEDDYPLLNTNKKKSGSNYWKNLYLNSLNTMSNDQTPLYGSLLNGNSPGYGSNAGSTPIPVVYLINPSYNSLLGNNSSLQNTGDATSGIGMGVGASAAGAGASAAGASAGAGAGASAAGSSAAGSSAKSGPVQPSAGAGAGAGAGGTGTSSAYLLNSQNNTPNVPVSGCGTGNSNTNNCRPSPVPPCPPCERCPEASFDCKRVPRYNSATNNQYLPEPVLADFSQFAM